MAVLERREILSGTDLLMYHNGGCVSIHVVDALVEQLVLAHREQAAKIARLRAELRADTAAIRREIAETERRVRDLLAGNPSAS